MKALFASKVTQFVALLCCIAILVTACQPVQSASNDNTSAGQPINEVTIVAADYSFEAPDTIPAGWTNIRLENQGTDMHHAQLLKLPADKTLDDLFAAMQANPEHPPAWLSYAGGPGAIIPGDEAATTVNLEPGNYVVVCFVPDAEGVPHVAHGMVRPLTVTESPDIIVDEPEVDVTLELFDYSFALSEEITSGEMTFKVVNNGPQPHEVAVIQLMPDVTMGEFLESVMPGAEGPPLGKPIGGLASVDAGAEGYFAANFSPGNYALMCFHPDEQSGAPHIAHGMMQQFTVK